MNRKTKIKEYLPDEEKIHKLKFSNINVEIKYSKSNRRIDECILEILKQKSK